jgi:hypothetical protein
MSDVREGCDELFLPGLVLEIFLTQDQHLILDYQIPTLWDFDILN